MDHCSFEASKRCQHNVAVRSQTANDRRLSKNTCCEAKITCTLLTCADKTGRLSRSKDPHLPEYLAIVCVYNVQNHNMFVSDALRHRDVGAKTIETLTQLFEIGHSPSSALTVLKNDLQMDYGEDYIFTSANRCLCRDLQFCYQPDTVGSSASLIPLGTWTENCRVFLLLTHTCAGGLPLGVILTQPEDEATILEGLQLLKDMLRVDAFAGIGQAGHRLIITDDCKAERGALGRAFPGAKLLLCTFHLLQSVWRCLWGKESGVDLRDRQTLFTVGKYISQGRDG
ncbi:hypothetical protein J4Q44_G00113720 [Coregonus suidteri]|uniref:MULE transposase domain-containing protein n=1 Tax=Coregonus suidteri TaxID=861788 RepID=A0AAN8QZG9_9TELE